MIFSRLISKYCLYAEDSSIYYLRFVLWLLAQTLVLSSRDSPYGSSENYLPDFRKLLSLSVPRSPSLGNSEVIIFAVNFWSYENQMSSRLEVLRTVSAQMQPRGFYYSQSRPNLPPALQIQLPTVVIPLQMSNRHLKITILRPNSGFPLTHSSLPSQSKASPSFCSLVTNITVSSLASFLFSCLTSTPI